MFLSALIFDRAVSYASDKYSQWNVIRNDKITNFVVCKKNKSNIGDLTPKKLLKLRKNSI